MKQYYLIFCFVLISIGLNAQTANIFIHSNFSNYPDATEINRVYTNVGFSTVNITAANVDATLTTSNYNIAYIVEYYNYSTASPVFLTNAQRQIVQQFVEDGGHVVWIAESIDSYISSSVTPPVNSNAITTISNVYSTNLTYGPFFNNGGMGSPYMPRIHPSAGPGGLSEQGRILSSGSYATLLNVPAANKLYTSDFYDNTNFFDTCTHTTMALFPAQPIASEGSILISAELGAPFNATSVGPFGGAPFVHNTILDSTIAVLHLKLATNANMSAINNWANTSSNTNASCPPTTLLSFDFLTKFDAKATENKTVMLNWSIEKTHPIYSFTIEKSTTGVVWNRLAKQRATASTMYSEIDEHPFYSKSYYRLKLLDHEGVSYYSEIKAVEIEEPSHLNLTIYPNPTTNAFTIEHSNLKDIEKWMLLDQIGREVPLVVLSKEKDKILVDVSHLSTGIYLLRTNLGTRKVHRY